MNPYNVLQRLGSFNPIEAVLLTQGAQIPIEIKAERREIDTIAGAFDGLTNVRAWSVDASIEIAAGYALAVDGDVFPIIRGDNGDYWGWLYNRPGTRKIFYTRAKNA